MKRIAGLWFAAVSIAVVAPASPVMAEEAAPRVSMMSTNADELLRKIEFTMALSEDGRQQWPELVEYLEVFLIGIERTQPARIDVILDGGQVDRYRPSFPVEDIRTFRIENLDSLGIDSRQIAGTLYRLRNAFQGFMRYKDGYATFAEVQEDIPLDLPDPREGIAHLLERQYDLAFDGDNPDRTEQGLQQRREAFQRQRQERLAALEPEEDESEDDFTLRKTLFEIYLDETERLYVEATRFLLGGSVDVSRQDARVDLQVVPIEGTALDESVQSLAQRPSHFANVSRMENPILSGRANVPLDEMRRENLLTLSQVLRDRLTKETDADPDLTDDEKTASRQAIELFFDMLDDGIRTELFDGFVESHPNPQGGNTLVAGVQAADGNAAIDILKLLPQARRGMTVELEADEEAGVVIHRVTAPENVLPEFQQFFGSDTLFVGTAENTLWWASGEGALSELKAAVANVAMPNAGQADAPFLDVFMKPGPWAELLDQLRGTEGDVDLRRRAIESFQPGDDDLTLRLERVEDRVDGLMHGGRGILRFAGRLFAQFTREIDQ